MPLAIFALETASTEADALKAYWQIDNTVVVQGAVHEAALASIPCLLGCLLRCTAVARPQVLELLVQIGGGEAADTEVEVGNTRLLVECLKEIARGFPLYVDILEHSKNPNERTFCVDLLGLSARADSSLRNRVVRFLEATRKAGAAAGLLRLIASWEEEVAL